MDGQNSVSNFQLRFGYWWLLHRQKVLFVLRNTLFGIIALFGFYQLVSLSIFLISIPAHNRVLQVVGSNQINYKAFSIANKLADIQIDRPAIISAGESTSDFVVTIANPNERWGARRVDYTIEVSGKVLKAGNTSLLPKEQKRIVILGYKGADQISSATLQIKYVDWLFITPLTNPKPVSFDIANVLYTPGELVTNDIGQFVSRSYVTFDVKNTSAFALKNIEFNVLLMNEGVIVGVNKGSVSQLANETPQQVTVSWFQEIPAVDKVIVEPVFDSFDDQNFGALKGEYKDLFKN